MDIDYVVPSVSYSEKSLLNSVQGSTQTHLAEFLNVFRDGPVQLTVKSYNVTSNAP